MKPISQKSLANLVLTPEKRKENHRKMSVTQRRNRDKRYKELWDRAVGLGVVGLSNAEIGKALDVSPHTVRRVKLAMKGILIGEN